MSTHAETDTARLPITGVVLAGGRSRRMGTDKALLSIDGDTLVMRVSSALAEVCSDVIVAASDSAALAEVPLPPSVRVIADEVSFQGPLGGIATALAAARSQWVFAVAVDMPFVQPQVVRLLWDALCQAEAAADPTECIQVVLPVGEAGAEPLLALYNRDCLDAVRATLAAGGRRMADLRSRTRVLEIPLDTLRAVDPELVSLVNINTAEDLATAIATAGDKGTPTKPTPTTVDEARERVLASFERMEPEAVALGEALGRVLARPLTSDVDVAPFDNSAMDGFAVRARDVADASADMPVELAVVDEIPAGSMPSATIGEGQAARIMTGAPVPEGADAVVKIEDTRLGEKSGTRGGTVALVAPLAPGQSVRGRGEDIRMGEQVLAQGEAIGPAAIGLAASTGNAEVWVHRRPRVAVLSTGDELVDVTATPGPGTIRDSNSPTLAALVSAAGGIPIRYDIVRDTPDAVRTALDRACAQADVIVTSGGVSVGDYDVVRSVLSADGHLEFWSVAMRPGAPQTFGTYGGVPFFGLPGNPTSAYIGFELFVRPALRKMQGFTALDRPRVTARLGHPVKKPPGRRHFLRAHLSPAASDGAVAYTVESAGSQSSALLTTMHRANCLLVLPEKVTALAAGDLVECIRLDAEEGTP